jgi:predicted nucleotidyltransferase
VRHEPSGLDADVVSGSLPFERETVARAVLIEVGGVRISLPRPEDLIIFKAVAATPEDLEAILQTCLEKEIDLELILQKWQVSSLEELDGARAQQVQEWLKGQ